MDITYNMHHHDNLTLDGFDMIVTCDVVPCDLLTRTPYNLGT